MKFRLSDTIIAAILANTALYSPQLGVKNQELSDFISTKFNGHSPDVRKLIQLLGYELPEPKKMLTGDYPDTFAVFKRFHGKSSGSRVPTGGLFVSIHTECQFFLTTEGNPVNCNGYTYRSECEPVSLEDATTFLKAFTGFEKPDGHGTVFTSLVKAGSIIAINEEAPAKAA